MPPPPNSRPSPSTNSSSTSASLSASRPPRHINSSRRTSLPALLTRSPAAHSSINQPRTRLSATKKEASSSSLVSTTKPKQKPKKKSLQSLPLHSGDSMPKPPVTETDSPLPPLDNDADVDSDLTTLPSLSDAEHTPSEPVQPAPVAQGRRGSRRSLPARFTPAPSRPRPSLRPRVAPLASPLLAGVPDKYSLEHMLAEQAKRQSAQLALKRKREQVALFYDLHGQEGGQQVLEGFPGGRELGCTLDDGGLLTSSEQGQKKTKKKNTRIGRRGGAHQASVSDEAQKQQDRIQALQIQEQDVCEMADKNLGAQPRRVIRVLPGSPSADDQHPVLTCPHVLGDTVFDDDALGLVDEVVANINYGCSDPARFPTDLLAWLPASSSAPALHALLVQLLMTPLKDARYPSTLARRTMYVLSDVARQTGGRQLSGAWLVELGQALSALGVVLEPDAVPVGAHESTGGEAAVERVGMVLDVAEMLVEWSCLDDDGLVWLFGAALQIGVDPRAAALRASTGGIVGHVLAGHTGTLGVRLMARMLTLSTRLETWTNRLEMLRLVGAEKAFRRWAALGLLDLANSEGAAAEEAVAGLVEWMAQNSDGFSTGPSARELCDTLKPASSRLHQPTGAAGSRPRPRPGPQPRPDQFRLPFSLDNNSNTSRGESRLVLSDQQFSSAIEVLQMSCCGVWDYLIDSKNAGEIEIGRKEKKKRNDRFVKEGDKEDGVERGLDDMYKYKDGDGDMEMDDDGQKQDERGEEDKGNFWMICLAKNLSRLDRLIKHNMSMNSLRIKVEGDSSSSESEDEKEQDKMEEDEDEVERLKKDEERVGKEGGVVNGIGSFNQAERVKLKNVVFRLKAALEFMYLEGYLRVKGVDLKGQTKLTKYLKKN